MPTSNLRRHMPPRRFVDPCLALQPRPRCRARGAAQLVLLATAPHVSLHSPAHGLGFPPVAGQDGAQARTAARIGYVDVDEASAAGKKAPPTCATARPYRPLVNAHAFAACPVSGTQPPTPWPVPSGPGLEPQREACGLAHTLATPGPFATPTRCPCFWQVVHPNKLPSGRRKCPVRFLRLHQPSAQREPQVEPLGNLESLPKRQEPGLVDGWRGWQRVAVRIHVCR